MARRWLGLLLLICVLPGCPRRSRTLGMPEVPQGGDAAARARFQEARLKFERDGKPAAAGEFAAIAREYPDDPIVPHALLYAGMAAVQGGDHAQALAPLDELEALPEVDDTLRRRGRLYQGLAHGYLGHHDRALALLTDEAAAIDDHERGDRLAVLAEASAASGRPADALTYYDRFYGLARPGERAYIVSKTRALVDQLDADGVRRAYRALGDRRGPAAALLGARLAADLAAAGDPDGAEQVREDTAAARRELGLETGPVAGGGDPALVGAVLPMSGKRGRVGVLVMRGLALAAGTFADVAGGGVRATGVPRPFTVSLRDTRSLAAAAADAVADLAGDGAIAIVGPLDRESVEAAARRADGLGVPVISLAPGGEAASPYLFHLMLSPEARARALARHGFAAGAKVFAVLAPDSGYGKSAGQAFRQEVERLGGKVLVEASYPAAETGFVDVVRKIAGKPWDALFVPDTARTLELIAPALAVANLHVLPAAAKAPRRGRKILLLSTAEALAPSYLRGSGRYSEGAILAPGFYPDAADERLAAYADRFAAVFGSPPTYLDAYAYDAALVVRAAVEGGARNRSELGAAMAAGEVAGLTGTIRFDGGRRRADDGVLYTVVKDAAGQFAIRAVRPAGEARISHRGAE